MQLARIPQEITLKDIVEAFEGPLMLSECIPGDDFCPFEDACNVRPRWTRLQEVILDELASTSFLDLAEETKAKRSIPPTNILPLSA